MYNFAPTIFSSICHRPAPKLQGVVFPLTKKGDRATTSTAKEIFGAALEPVDKIAAEKVCYLKCPICWLFNDERQIFIDISPFFHCQIYGRGGARARG